MGEAIGQYPRSRANQYTHIGKGNLVKATRLGYGLSIRIAKQGYFVIFQQFLSLSKYVMVFKTPCTLIQCAYFYRSTVVIYPNNMIDIKNRLVIEIGLDHSHILKQKHILLFLIIQEGRIYPTILCKLVGISCICIERGRSQFWHGHEQCCVVVVGGC